MEHSFYGAKGHTITDNKRCIKLYRIDQSRSRSHYVGEGTALLDASCKRRTEKVFSDSKELLHILLKDRFSFYSKRDEKDFLCEM